jgi:uncharacterized membrane protein
LAKIYPFLDSVASFTLSVLMAYYTRSATGTMSVASFTLSVLMAYYTRSATGTMFIKLANLFPNRYSYNELLKVLIMRVTNSFSRRGGWIRITIFLPILSIFFH